MNAETAVEQSDCNRSLIFIPTGVDAVKSHGGCALVQAARQGHVKRLQALITAGADVNKILLSFK